MAKEQGAPSMDYEELRRRHAEFKAQQRKKAESEEKPAIVAADEAKSAVNEDIKPQDTAPIQRETPEEPAEIPFEAESDVPEDMPAVDRAEDNFDEYEGDIEESNNPFSSILGAFGKIKNKVSGMRRKKSEDVIDDSDEYGYSDEEEPEEKPEEKHGEFKLFRRAKPVEEIEEEPAEEAPEAEDLPEEAPEAEDLPEAEAPQANAEEEEIEFGDTDYEDEAEEAEPRKSGLKRFVNLFIVKDEPLSDEEFEAKLYDDDEGDEEEKPVRVAPAKAEAQYDDSLFVRKGAPLEDKGGSTVMDEERKPTTDIVELMSEGLGEKTLSRRERRELAAKRAAASENADAGVDEPTREYKPVQRPAAQPTIAVTDEADDYEEPRKAKKVKPVYEETDDYADSRRSKKAKSRAADDDDYEDDYEEPKAAKSKSRYDDEDDDYVEPRKAKKSKSRYDDEDEDDYDEPRKAKKSKSRYDDEDDEDDYIEPRKAKKSKSRYDDEDDEDDYEEPRKAKKSKSRYDDEDDYDEYDDDEYDDDEYDEEPRKRSRRSKDDYYDEDDEEPGASHYVLGFFRILIGVILILVIAVFGMYFADRIKDGGFAPYRWISEKVPFINEVLPPEATENPENSEVPGFPVDSTTTAPEDSVTTAPTEIPDNTPVPEITDAPETTEGTGAVG